jgi:hypothetical protein
MSKLAVGARVSVKDKEEEYGPGVVRFVGATKFATGDWVGIELDSPSTSDAILMQSKEPQYFFRRLSRRLGRLPNNFRL